MTAYLNDRILDRGLIALLDGNSIKFCTEQPADYASVAGVTLGGRDAPTLTGPADASPNGRKVTIAAILDGVGTATGDAAFWVLVDTVNSRVLAGDVIDPVQPIVNGDPITFPEVTIRFPDAL